MALQKYLPAGIVTALVIFGFYQYNNIGYGVVGLSAINKSMAMSTLFLLGIVLILGTLARQFVLFDKFLKYRKELGILTFYTSLIHVYLVMFPLSRNGPWGLYLSRPWSAFPGLIALLIMFFLVVISDLLVKKIFRPEIWWKIQNWGARIAFILIAFHMIVLKYSGWVSWFTKRESLPPLAILGAVFTSLVLFVRFSEFFSQKTAKYITQISFFLTIGFTAWLFIPPRGF